MKTRRLRVVLCLVTLLIVFGGWLAYKQDQRDRLRGPLIEAVLHQDNAETSRLLALGADANTRDIHLQHFTLWENIQRRWYSYRHPQTRRQQPVWPTALMLAATGARLDSRCSDYPNTSIDDLEDHNALGGTPVCATQDQPALVQALLDHGADVNAAGQDDMTALTVACAWGNAKIARLLLDRGAKLRPGGQELPLAVESGSVPLAALLLDRGADTHSPGTHSPGTQLQDLLVAALGQQHPAMAALLLDRGANINAPGVEPQTTVPQTPLEATLGSPALVGFALAHGADPNLCIPVSKDSEIDCPLVIAVALTNDPRLIRLLLDHGADINGGPARKFRPIQAALYFSSSSMPDALTYLVGRGADVNCADADSLTPLMFCRSHPEAALLLMAHGAKVNARAFDGTTPLMMASKGVGDPSGAATVRALLVHGADRTLRDRKGRTALMLATDPAVRQALTRAPAHH